MKSMKKGFTLIELLVVIAIIGILSSVVLASLNTARLKARDSRRVSDIKSIQLALELYADSNSGAYPVSTGLASNNQGLTSGLVPTYISKIPEDPGSNAQSGVGAGGKGAYYYASSAGTEYHLGAVLENAGNIPSNDVNCKSTATVNCGFSAALTGGFDASAANNLYYDQKN